MPQDDTEHEEIRELIQQNRNLLEENQKLLQKMHRYVAVGFWFKILWLIILIGLPFALYFYVLEPYFAAFGGSFEVFVKGLNELPGAKSIDILFNQGGGN